MTPHVHAAVIKAWADGAQIQLWIAGTQEWKDVGVGGYPIIFSAMEKFRVKPEPRPDWTVNLSILKLEGGGWILSERTKDNITLTYDGETRKLKEVKLINNE